MTNDKESVCGYFIGKPDFSNLVSTYVRFPNGDAPLRNTVEEWVGRPHPPKWNPSLLPPCEAKQESNRS